MLWLLLIPSLIFGTVDTTSPEARGVCLGAYSVGYFGGCTKTIIKLYFIIISSLFVRVNAAHIIACIIFKVNAIAMCVDVLRIRFLASWLICNPSPWSGLSKKIIQI